MPGAGETEAVVAGFLAALAERAPTHVTRDRALPARVLALAADIADRHRGRAGECGPHLRAAAVVLAAYRLLERSLPAAELAALLRDCWARGLRSAPPSPVRARLESWADPGAVTGSRWQSLAAMLFCMAGLPAPTMWLVERLAPTSRAGRAIEQSLCRDLCAAESAPELARLFQRAAPGHDGA